MKDMKEEGHVPGMVTLLTHRSVCLYIIQYRSRLTYPSQTATRIVEDIWAKWDFDRSDTLPAKTIRLGPEHNRFKNTGTGEVYMKE
jgi:hypothetical protein